MSGVAFGPAAPGVPGLVPASGVTSAMVANGSLVDADVAAGAAIAQAKLALVMTRTVGVAAPANGVASAAVGGQLGTEVFGALLVSPTVGVADTVTVQVENGVGSGAYDIIYTETIPAAGVVQQKPIRFFVPTGRRFKWTATANGTLSNLTTVSF